MRTTCDTSGGNVISTVAQGETNKFQPADDPEDKIGVIHVMGFFLMKYLDRIIYVYCYAKPI